MEAKSLLIVIVQLLEESVVEDVVVEIVLLEPEYDNNPSPSYNQNEPDSLPSTRVKVAIESSEVF